MTHVQKSLTFFSRIRPLGGPVDILVWPAGRLSTWGRGSSTSREMGGIMMLVTVLELEVDGGDLGNISHDEGSSDSEEVGLRLSGVVLVILVCGWLVNEAADIWGAYNN